MKKDTPLADFQGRDLQRQKIRIRDSFTCQWCGRFWDGQRRLDVHHIDGDKKKTLAYDKEEGFDNMITLCHKCHLNLPQTIQEMNKVTQVFLDRDKGDLLKSKIDEYFRYCIKKNKPGFADRLQSYKGPQRGPKGRTLEERRNEPRRKKMWKMRQEGHSLRTIGGKVGLTGERVRQLLVVFERID